MAAVVYFVYVHRCMSVESTNAKDGKNDEIIQTKWRT